MNEWIDIIESIYGETREIEIIMDLLTPPQLKFVEEVLLNPMFEVYYPTIKVIVRDVSKIRKLSELRCHFNSAKGWKKKGIL